MSSYGLNLFKFSNKFEAKLMLIEFGQCVSSLTAMSR